MNKTRTDYVIELLCIVAMITNFYTVYKAWVVFENIPSYGILYFPFLFLMLFIYATDIIVLRKARYENTIYIANIVLFIVSIAFGLLVVTDFHDIDSLLALAFKVIIFLFFTAFMFNIASNSVLPGQLMMQFEISLVLLVLMNLSASADKKPNIFATVLLMTALIMKRAEQKGSARVTGNPFGSVVMLFTGAGAAGLIAYLISFLFTGIVNSILHKGVRGFMEFLGFLGSSIAAFFNYLLSLLPDAEEGGMVMEPAQQFMMPTAEEIEESSNPMALIILAALLTVFLIGCVIVFLYKNRNQKTERKQNVIDAKLYSIQASFRKILEKIFGRIRHAFLVLKFRLTKGNTIQGLFWRMDDFGKRNHVPRKPGESGSSYLKRISELKTFQKTLSGKNIKDAFTAEEIGWLMKLAESYTLAFYSGGSYVPDKKMLSKCRKILKRRI